MTSKARTFARLGSLVCLLSAGTQPAFAQTAVRVAVDQATIWTVNFATIAAVVPAGTVLTVVDRRGDWYQVILPSNLAGRRETGFIFKSNIELVPLRAVAGAAEPAARRPPPESDGRPAASILAFGDLGYTRFAAHESFAAVMGDAGGVLFGGGAEVRLRQGWFVNAAIEHFNRTGQRAFVIDGDVFRLGTPDTITLTPIGVRTGWRFAHDRAIPYMGAGIGTVFYSETSKFVDASDNVNRRFTSYHVFGGLEIRNEWVGTAFEVEYSRVPDALGVGGVSAAFHESNLGGIVGRVKILVGR
jgi:hypothetical protein